MPELPEVETIKLGLQKKIIGLKITKIQINSPKSFLGDSELVKHKKVLNVWRKAKVLGIDLGDISILFHLKMTGQVIFDDPARNATHSVAGGGKRFVGGHPTQDMKNKMPNSHTRVVFDFSDNSHLYFNDQRRFGWIRVMDNAKLTMDNLFKKLGPEPLEIFFSWEILKANLLRHKSMPVKVAIMDQSVLSGVGNIYASEACFDAKINPSIKVKDLTDKQIKNLHSGIIKSLKDGIKYGGATRAHFVDSDGHKGYFLDYAFVYGKDRNPCKICGSEIKKIQLGGRGTYFCPACQRYDA